MRVDAESFSRYRAWQKYILSEHPKIPGYRKAYLYAYCVAMAEKGFNGKNCFAGDALIARQLGVKRDVVTKYRHLALKLGWFVKTGERRGRAEVLDIAIPLSPDTPITPVIEPVSDIETQINDIEKEFNKPKEWPHDEDLGGDPWDEADWETPARPLSIAPYGGHYSEGRSIAPVSEVDCPPFGG